MATPPPALNPRLKALAAQMGEQIRAQRKRLKVTAVAAAEAAGMSRVTWHRIEKGEVSATLGSYMLAADVVGLGIVLTPAGVINTGNSKEVIPVKIALAEYPQLQHLAWQVSGVDSLTPAEALDYYERNWRHVDQQALTPKERTLIDALRLALRGNQKSFQADSGNQDV